MEIDDLFELRANRVPLKEYIDFCLYSRNGFYKSNPFGKNCSFVTAPMISSIFGDCIALFLVNIMNQYFSKYESVNIIEIGCGNGKLLRDISSCVQKISQKSINYFALDKNIQNLQYDIPNLQIIQNITEIPVQSPAFIISNELFDAYPIDQFCYKNNAWQKLFVRKSNNELELFLSEDFDKIYLNEYIKKYYSDIKTQEILEISTEKDKDFSEMCHIINKTSGLMLHFDYGESSINTSTLQSIYNHQKVSITKYPMKSDITHLIDFGILRKIAQNNCEISDIKLETQRDFLVNNGILALQEEYCKNSPEKIDDIKNSVKRLIDPEQMGEIFKAFHFVKS